MEDPCKRCLVKVTCWQECEDKKNYAILLSNALKQYNTPYAMVTYRKQWRMYLKLTDEHVLSRSQINKRARLMSESN